MSRKSYSPDTILPIAEGYYPLHRECRNERRRWGTCHVRCRHMAGECLLLPVSQRKKELSNKIRYISHQCFPPTISLQMDQGCCNYPVSRLPHVDVVYKPKLQYPRLLWNPSDSRASHRRGYRTTDPQIIESHSGPGLSTVHPARPPSRGEYHRESSGHVQPTRASGWREPGPDG